MRYLVLGGAGMAGHVVARFLAARGHDVDTVARSHRVVPVDITLDVTDRDGLDRVVTGGVYDVVVNCVGMLIEACERDPAAAVLTNAHLPQYLAGLLAGRTTRLIQLSTDCVFSGKAGPYAEGASYDGQRVYDRSKALGEVVNGKDLTLRMSIIGPEVDAGGDGLFNWFARQQGRIKGYTRALWNGVTTVELARAIEALSAEDVSGLVHLVPAESVSKFELLHKLDAVFGAGLEIEPYAGYVADKRLLNTRQDLRFEVSGYDRMLIELREWVTSNALLYPHYRELIGAPGSSEVAGR